MTDDGGGFFRRGRDTPLYALFLACTNDFLSVEEMPAASGGLVFACGLGAITGPLATWLGDGRVGAIAFWLVLGATFGAIALYAPYRMTQRAAAPAEELPRRAAHRPGRRSGGSGRVGRRAG